MTIERSLSNLKVSDRAPPVPWTVLFEPERTSRSAAIKDCFDVAGLPTSMASLALSGTRPAQRSAAVVRRLIAAGIAVRGRTTMHELAFGVTGVNAAFGTAPNPHFPRLIPGGSSSGSASVVAAGKVDFALGTDTGGSVRMPAACCGIVGFKPTFGRLSRKGVRPYNTSLDCVGILARSLPVVEDAMAILDPLFMTATGTDATAIGVVDVDADPIVLTAFSTALNGLDIRIRQIRIDGLEQGHEAGLTIISAEMWSEFGHLVDWERLGPDVRKRLKAASSISPQQVTSAEHVRALLTQTIDQALRSVDAIALPTLPGPPPRLDDAEALAKAVDLTRLVRPFNLTGHPAITLPLAEAFGVPVGLQLVGRRGEDSKLCAVARMVERRLHRHGD